MAYMRVARARADPTASGQERQVLQDVVAAIKRQPGCQSCVSGVDHATGHTLIVNTWDTGEHARFSRDALGNIIQRVQALGGQQDPREFFEVTAQA